MTSFEDDLAKTLGVKLPEEYVTFMKKYGKKLPADPASQKSWVLGLGDAHFVAGTTEAFRSNIPNFPMENVVIGYAGVKTIVINKTNEEIDNYVMMNTRDGKILSIDSLGSREILAGSFNKWAGVEILGSELKEKYKSILTVILFDDELKAEEARVKLIELQRQGYVDLEDVVVVIKEADGTAKYLQSDKMAKKGGVVGSITGLIAGALVMQPLVGALLGALAGVVSASLEDAGIDDNFIKDLTANFKPGSSALFALVVKAQPEKILETFKGFGGKILVTSMTKENAAKLQANLDAVQESISKDP